VEGATFFDAVGGHATFTRLIEAFYARVADDAELRAI
jgi:truncated hemoglobin YjbI